MSVDFALFLSMSVHFKIERGKHMKNSLGALNEYLFMQLDALSNQDLKGEELKEEISRSNAITNIAKEIISNANVVLQSKKYATEYITEIPKMLEG